MSMIQFPGFNSGRVLMLAVVLTLAACGRQSTEEALSHAKTEWSEGRQASAIVELRALLQRDPDNAEARWLLGRGLFLTGAAQASQAELEKAIALGWKDPEARVMLNEILLGANSFQRVLDMTKDFQGDARFVGLRGLAQLGLKQVEDAKASFEQALKLDSRALYAMMGHYRLALMNGDTVAAEAALAAAEREHPDEVAVLQSRGWFELGRGNLDTGIEAYRKAVAVQPKNLSSRVGLIRGLLAKGEVKEGKEELAPLQKTHANHPVILYYGALADYLSGNFNGAADKARLALSMVPNHFATQLLLARTLFLQGKTEQAADLLQAVLQQAPDLVVGKKLLASIELNRNRPDEALAQLKALHTADSADPHLLAMLGEAYVAKGEYDKGADFFDRAVKTSPDSRDIRAQLAQTRILAGDVNRGESELEALATADKGIDRTEAILISLHIREGKFDDILQDADRLQKKAPDSAAPDNMRGIAYVLKKDFAAARSAFTKALDRDPELIEARVNLANLEVQDGQFDSARESYEKVLAKQRNHTGAATGLGVLELMTGKTQEGRARLEAVRANDKSADRARRVLAEHYLAEQDFKNALRVSGELWASLPGDPDALLLVARASLGAGKTKQALAALNALNGLRSDNTAVQLLLSEALAADQKFADAQTTVDRVLKREPANALAGVMSARLALRQGNLPAASALSSKLLAAAPHDPQVLGLVGDVAMAEGQGDDAVKALSSLHQQFPSLMNTVHLAQAHQLKGDFETAGALLDKWMEQHPDNADVGIMLALNHDKRGATAEGVSLLEKLNKQFPDNGNVLNNLAWLYQKQGNAAALDTAEQAARVAPNDPNITDTLGWILVSRGSLERGNELLRDAVKGMPGAADVRYRLAVGLAKAGNTADARSELKKALETPQFTERKHAEELYKQLQ